MARQDEPLRDEVIGRDPLRGPEARKLWMAEVELLQESMRLIEYARRGCQLAGAVSAMKACQLAASRIAGAAKDRKERARRGHPGPGPFIKVVNVCGFCGRLASQHVGPDNRWQMCPEEERHIDGHE